MIFHSSLHFCSTLRNQLHWQKVQLIVHEAVEIETQFVCDALPCALIGMNSELMSQYIKFVADHLLVSLFLSLIGRNIFVEKLRISIYVFQVALGCPRKYNVQNPFDWMEFISLQ